MAARIKAALRKLMRTDKVRPFVWVYYVPLMIWGLYGTFFAAPPTYVRPAMGGFIYNAWVWLHVVGTLMVMGGLLLESRAKTRAPSELRDNMGRTSIHMQTGGHGIMFLVLLAYEVSAINMTVWGEGNYTIFVISPYVVGCLLLMSQGIFKIVAREWDRDAGS